MKKAIIVVAAVVLGVALGAPASSASAHAYLARSNPEAGAVLAQPPAHVLLWFSESIELAFSRAQLIDSSGKRYDNNDFHLHFKGSDAGFTTVGDVPNGTYTIVWDVISSVDGHRTKGTVPFFVGPPPDPSAAPASITVPDIG